MRKRSAVLTGVSVVVLLATSSLALYYRSQAVHFQREYSAAMARLDRLNAETVTPAPAASRGAVARKTPAAPREADAGRPAARPDPEPLVAETNSSAPLADVTMLPRAPEPDRLRRRSADWMENLRTNDPQRYLEFQQRRLEIQQNMQNAWGQTTNYFMNRDLSKMTPADLDEYNTMITLLGQTWALSQQLQSGLPPDVRQQVVATLRSNIVAVVPLLDSERNREYYDTAVAMGQSEQDAATMVSYINQITSNTSLRAILPGVRVGGMPGGVSPFPGGGLGGRIDQPSRIR